MNRVFLNSIGTAVPKNQLDQENSIRFMSDFMELPSKSRAEALFRASGIKNRYSILSDYSTDSCFSFFPNSTDLEPFPGTEKRMQVYKTEALELAKRSIHNAVEFSSFSLGQVTHLITVSCTGMYAPGLDFDLQVELNLSESLKRSSINFMGCYAAITALRHANDICKGNPEAVVLVVCVETCTIHFQKDYSEDNLLANALFADGSASAIVSSKNEGVEIKGFHSALKKKGSSEMAWNIGNNGFLMKLSSYVPEIIKEDIPSFIEEIKQIYDIDNFQHFAFHPGGKKILQYIKEQLKLSEELMHFSFSILKEYGNMSSPSILFVLKKLIEESDISNQEHILSMAFGPGLTFESMVLHK